MTNLSEFVVVVANESHVTYAQQICDEMESSAKARGTGIAKRKPEYVAKKMEEGKAVIALHPDGKWAGFCYIETWGHGKYVANSGLIVSPDLRKSGLARQIKQRVFELSRTKYPDAKIFGLTTALAVMKINSSLGYKPVTYSELTDDEEFWKGCQSCVNFEILTAKNRSNCLCTAMLFDPAQATDFVPLPVVEQKQAPKSSPLQERWRRYRQHLAVQPVALANQGEKQAS
ncbi:GNAT family N-acetyltransferase [Pontibacter sp. SGAir0037]|uniref:GNAT family N-acetyltransferase n=1 Tax=Pontibacter sp. SGAir0037 TaxID=2571030 RepID=UPI0010CCBDF1|nr:GNAT family N-acetyltransferase [Pontibacter sp. SGAir0037]QCR24932.1 N-acetyltransferase [Pontibacter sp. SGAir0037]